MLVGTETEVEHTRVISVVRASISRSSTERSENPGRTCFAWSLSRAVTGKGSNENYL
jgi:hypothetical protein